MDVNVHPTKELVYFLDEAQIIEAIERKLFELMEDFRTHGIIEPNKVQRSSSSQA
jgi:DNA mismatch repair ATPase MutL